jgi:hypothetical protein
VTARSALAGPQRTLPELQDALFLDFGDVPGKMFRFWVLLVLSAIIATAGILADSTAAGSPPARRWWSTRSPAGWRQSASCPP